MALKAGPFDGLFKDLARLSLGVMGLGVLSVLCVATHLTVTKAWASPSAQEASALASRGGDGACKCCRSAWENART